MSAETNRIDLSQALGIPASLHCDTWVVESLEFIHESPSFRLRRALEPYLYHQTRLSEGVSYVMIRDLRTPKDEPMLLRRGLRVDLTVLLPEPLGEEYNKTLGHYHPTKPGTDLTYPELYLVLSGSGVILLEHRHEAQVIDDVLLVEVVAGQYLIVPPGYGHVTVNLGPERLMLMNVVAREFISDYSDFADHHGAAYHLVRGSDGPKLLTSQMYQLVAPARWVTPRELPEIQVFFYEPMYSQVVNSDRLDWLTQPEASPWLFERELFLTSQREAVRLVRHPSHKSPTLTSV